MNDFIKQQFKGDRVIWAVYIFLVAASLVEGYSAQSFFVSRAHSTTAPLLQHAMHLAIGFVAMLCVMSVNYRYIRMLGYVVWCGSVLMLLYTMVRGEMVNGAVRSFSGLEFAKLGLILVVADWVTRAHDHENTDFERRYFKWLVAAILVTCGLIFPGNLSTAALLFVVVLIMLWCGGVAWQRLLRVVGGVAVAVALVLSLAWVIPRDHFLDEEGHKRTDLNFVENTYWRVLGRTYTWKARIQRHVSSTENSETLLDDHLQVTFGKVAIANGGILPHLPGSSKVRNKLPQAYSDFVFTIIVEELGSILGGIGVIVLYLLILYRAGRIVSKSVKVYPAIVSIGVALIIVLQALIHVAVCVQLLPVTGQPLPLITRGGTSIVVTSIYFGLLLNVTHYASANNEASADILQNISSTPIESVTLVDEE